MLDEILGTLLEALIIKVLIGLHWTVVVVETEGGQQCGLASTLSKAVHDHGKVDVPQAGYLENLARPALANLANSNEPTLASVGVATINALLPRYSEQWHDLNAEEVIAQHGADKKVALVGHFPFVPRLRDRVGQLFVIDSSPQPGDWPAAAAAEILPQAEVVAITGTTLINHTLEELLAFCSRQALIILLGPSTPLSPLLFDQGVDILCGSVVTEISPVLNIVGQGGNFRQVHRAGIRTVTMVRPGYTY